MGNPWRSGPGRHWRLANLPYSRGTRQPKVSGISSRMPTVRDHRRTALYGGIASADRHRARCANVVVFAGVLFAAAALAGCSTSDGVGALMVDPGRYEGYNCKDLVGQWNGLVSREKQLRDLIDKADESTSGVVIGALTYRSDYETVLEQKKVLRRTAAEKKCQLTPTVSTFTSDQSIR
jgi:hypothetical protein